MKLRDAGATKEQLLSSYIARVRSTLESGAQVIDPLLSAVQAGEIEAVQQSCLQIVLGTESRSYTSNMASLGLTSLTSRRKVLVRDFAIACFKSPSHRWWFKPHPPAPLNTRFQPPRLLVPGSKVGIDQKRPFVAYSEALNSLSDLEWKELKKFEKKTVLV